MLEQDDKIKELLEKAEAFYNEGKYKEARKLKEEEAKIKAENVRREMERIVALKEEAMRKEES